MGTDSTTSHLTSFFEILTLVEIVLVRLIMFALFIYGAFHLARRFYNLENPHLAPSRSRKFDRSTKIHQEALHILTNPEVMARMFKKKPNWMPKWLWEFVVGLVIVK